MAIVALSGYSELPRTWQRALRPQRTERPKRVREFTRAAIRRRAAKVFRFHITHRQTAGNNGPGRRHKRR